MNEANRVKLAWVSGWWYLAYHVGLHMQSIKSYMHLIFTDLFWRVTAYACMINSWVNSLRHPWVTAFHGCRIKAFFPFYRKPNHYLSIQVYFPTMWNEWSSRYHLDALGSIHWTRGMRRCHHDGLHWKGTEIELYLHTKSLPRETSLQSQYRWEWNN
jgi:hypothetical protein